MYSAYTPEALAAAMGLSPVAATQWQAEYSALEKLKNIVAEEKLTHAEVARRARTSRTRITAILNDNLDHVSSRALLRILDCVATRR